MSYVRVKNSEVKGVDVRHPSIVRAVELGTKRGESAERLAKLIGVPQTVVQDIQRETRGKKVDTKGTPSENPG